MTHTRQLAWEVRRIAIGLLMIHLHLRVNGFDLLPDVMGWLQIALAVWNPALEREQPKTALLRGFALALGLWSLVELAEWLGLELPGWTGPVSLTMGLVSIYFYFQLLTELAQLAEKYPVEGGNLAGGLLKGRTWLTVLRTASVLLMSLRVDQDVLTVVVLVVLLAQFCCVLLVIAHLFVLAKGLERSM